ncbi:MAG: glutamate-1-semialdehyde 2,1-aminomutase [archaeon]|nr:glutamate-1-semialdehyde 2,1-aminomutase [archaeon]
MNTKKSEEMYSMMLGLTPAGVSSPVRAFKPYPLFAKLGDKEIIEDQDGNRYVDMCMAYGPLILGHCHPSVVTAVRKQMLKGCVYGMPSEAEMELLKRICEDVACADSVRLTNSGTEATMHAIRLARGFTKKSAIVKIDGGFHGSHNDLMVNGNGQKITPFSEGIPEDSIRNTRIVSYNDTEFLSSLLESDKSIAAVIMEPIPGNMGVILPKKGYLSEVRRITKENDVLLIFDEVITGYRVAKGGAQELFGVVPDMCTMGKIIGGGFPVGAFAGRSDIMEMVAPSGPIYEAGTFSGNPITAVAGLTTIKNMTSVKYEELKRKTEIVTKAVNDIINDKNITATLNSAPSMFQIFFGKESVLNAVDARGADSKIFYDFFRFMLKEGFYLPPSKMEVEFLSTAHSYDVVERFCEKFGQYVEIMKK